MLGIFDSICMIYMWLWMLYIAYGICSYLKISILTSWWRNIRLDLSADASLLEVLWVSFILAQLLRIVIRLVLQYFLSSIFIVLCSIMGPLLLIYVSRPSVLFDTYVVFVFVSLIVDRWVTQLRNWDHDFALSACSL